MTVVLALLLAVPASAWQIVRGTGGSSVVYQQVQTVPTDLGLSTLTADTDYFYAPGGSGIDYETLVSGDYAVPVCAGVSISDLRCTLSGDVGDVGDNVTCALRKNSADVLACTIAGAGGSETSCTDAASVSFVQGDLLDVRTQTTGATRTGAYLDISYVITPDTAGEFLYMAVQPNPHASNFRSMPLFGVASLGGTGSMKLPLAGTAKKLCARASGALTSGTFTVTIDKEGTPTALTTTLNSGAQSACDNANTATFALAEKIRFGKQGSSTPTPLPSTVAYCVAYVPDDGKTFFMGAHVGADMNTAARLLAVGNANGAGTAAVNHNASNHNAFTLTGVALGVDNAPDNGELVQSWTVEAWDGSAAALSCTIEETAGMCNGAGSVAVSDGGIMHLRTSSANTPAGSGLATRYILGERQQ